MIKQTSIFCSACLGLVKIYIILRNGFNHHQKLSHSYIPVLFFTIKTPISFAVEQLKTSDVCKKKQ